MILDSSGGLVWNEGGQVAVLGVHDVIVVYRAGQVLVCAESHAERVREVARALERDHTHDPSPPHSD